MGPSRLCRPFWSRTARLAGVVGVVLALPALLHAQTQPPGDDAPPPGSIPVTKPSLSTLDAKPKAEPEKVREPNAGGYKLLAGATTFSTTPALHLNDPARKKELEVRFRYPRLSVDGQTFPLVIVSHGAGGSNDAFRDLCNLIASHGYIVASPTHSDSIALRRRQGEQIVDPLREIQKLADKVDPIDRLADIKLILDSLEYASDMAPDMRDGQKHSKIDASRIAIIGHSAGAYTAQLAMGVRVQKADGSTGLVSMGDPRITCGVLISPQGTATKSLTAESWAELALPTLVVTGSQDSVSFTKETPESRRQPFDLAKPGDKYLVFVQGATHSSFGGKAAARALGDKPETDVDTITDTLASGVLAFLDAYLKGDKDGKDYLKGDGIKTVSKGKATVEAK